MMFKMKGINNLQEILSKREGIMKCLNRVIKNLLRINNNNIHTYHK